MKKSYKLELNFKTEEGRNKRLTIDYPKLDLTAEEIIPVMQTIVDTDIFYKEGEDSYGAVDSARYIETTIEEIFDNDDI